MKKAIFALVAMATLVLASVGDAEAQRRRGVPAGAIIGGIAAGALVGAAIATTTRPAYAGYAVVPGYQAYDGYYVNAPVHCPGGYWARRPVVDPYGNVVGYSRPRFFCP